MREQNKSEKKKKETPFHQTNFFERAEKKLKKKRQQLLNPLKYEISIPFYLNLSYRMSNDCFPFFRCNLSCIRQIYFMM